MKPNRSLRNDKIRERALFETLALGVIYQTPDGSITAANPAAQRILGMTLLQLQERNAFDRQWRPIHEDGTACSPEEQPAMVALRTGREVRDVVLGIVVPAREGYTWISVSAVPQVWSGEDAPCEVCTCFADITASKRAESALRENEERYQRITEGLTDYLYTVEVRDGHAVGTVHSPSCEAVTGYTREEFAADPYLWFTMIVPEDREPVVRHIGRILSGEKVSPLEHRITRKDGRVRWVLDTTIPHIDEAGRLVSYEGVVNDITRRKEAERLHIELERRLRHAQKLESLDVMAGGIAHDFNNLLMGIMGNLELALMKVGPTDDARPSIERAHHAACRAAELAGQMLAYSGRGLFVVRDLDLSSLVLENAQLLRSAISGTVALDLRPGRELPHVRADVAQFQQVLLSLVTNASEAIGEIEGVITVSTGVGDCNQEFLNRSVIEQKPRPGRFVRLAVADTGCGMNDETLQRMFDPFFSTKFTGRGLGLSAVLGIVKGHGGAIIVDSEPGHGTTVQVLLPASGR